MGRTHMLLGINSLWLLDPWLSSSDSSELVAMALVGAAFGSLLPDLDATSSLLQKVAFGGVYPFALPARVINRHFGHRGFLHSFMAMGLNGRLRRLTTLNWREGPLVFHHRLESGLSLFVPSAHLFEVRETELSAVGGGDRQSAGGSEYEAAVSNTLQARRDAVVTHSRTTYGRPPRSRFPATPELPVPRRRSSSPAATWHCWRTSGA